MSDDLEKEIALYEAERNRAWHSWFAARGHIPPTDENTLIFDGGFRMAWELCRAQPAPQPVDAAGFTLGPVTDGGMDRRNQQPAEQQPSVQKPVGFVSQDFLEGKWSLDHIAKSDEGQISRTIPVFTKPPQASEQRQNVTQLVEALEEGLRAIGDHHAPGDCYATGPMTGDPFRDLVQCPACSFIAMCDDLLAAHRKQGGSND